MNRKKEFRTPPLSFWFPVVGSLFTLPVPFTPILPGQTGGRGADNEIGCVNFGGCGSQKNQDSCQNMDSCGNSVNWNDCGNVSACEYSSNPDGCTNSVCLGSQNNGDGDWFLCEGCRNDVECSSCSGGPYRLTTPVNKSFLR